MRNNIGKQQAKLMSMFVCVSFLIIHIAMLILFRYYRVMPMFYFNIFSIAFYLCTFLIVSRGWLKFFAAATYLEVVAHMCAAIYFVGWECGFQVTLTGISFLMFYAEYVGRSIRISIIRALPVSLIGMAAYLVMFVVDHYHTVQYALPDTVSFWLQIFWGVVVFGITIFFLQMFVTLACRSEEILMNEVVHDELTGLYNRYYISEYLKHLDEHHELQDSWVAMADLDNFKQINDTYGHNCGDYVLQTVSLLLRSRSKGSVIARWGGEEFLIVGRDESDANRIIQLLENMRRDVEKYDFHYEGRHFPMTITVGAALYQPEKDTKQWIGLADQRLYEGKNSGKNKVVM